MSNYQLFNSEGVLLAESNTEIIYDAVRKEWEGDNWGVCDVEKELIVKPSTEFQANVVRKQRNSELSATDWTQVADAIVDKTAWAAYRQALRDIPAQEGFPFDVTYPVKPE